MANDFERAPFEIREAIFEHMTYQRTPSSSRLLLAEYWGILGASRQLRADMLKSRHPVLRITSDAKLVIMQMKYKDQLCSIEHFQMPLSLWFGRMKRIIQDHVKRFNNLKTITFEYQAAAEVVSVNHKLSHGLDVESNEKFFAFLLNHIQDDVNKSQFHLINENPSRDDPQPPANSLVLVHLDWTVWCRYIPPSASGIDIPLDKKATNSGIVWKPHIVDTVLRGIVGYVQPRQLEMSVPLVLVTDDSGLRLRDVKAARREKDLSAISVETGLMIDRRESSARWHARCRRAFHTAVWGAALDLLDIEFGQSLVRLFG
jgi:hypothetical protein